VSAVLVDSDILIDVSRGRDAAILERWENLGAADLVVLCSPVTVAELRHGARRSEHPIVDALFAALLCVPIDREVGRKAGAYLQSFAKSHHLELGDALIAATASVHQAALWTRNRKHYPMKDLRFY
jgi:hypothetical protein